MADISLIVRTADKARKAEITVPDTQTMSEIIQAAVDNWALPKDTDYTLTNVSRTPAQILNPSITIAKAELSPGDILELQPVLVAGI